MSQPDWADHIKPGNIVRLSPLGIKEGMQGKAISEKGIVEKVGPSGALCIRRDGIKTASWYASNLWAPNAPDGELAEMVEAIRANQDEFERCLVFADRLEEEGHADLAAAWRWMGRHRRRPRHEGKTMTVSRWSWHHERFVTVGDKRAVPEVHALPAVLMISRLGYILGCKRFATEDGAICFLADALKKLRQVLGEVPNG
jgi:hypothetical protein